MTPKKARIKDIALLAGVSIGTVDRVLHGRGEVAEKTRQKVQKILTETKYSPNILAKVLKSKKRYHIVSLLPEPTEINSFWQKHTSGLDKVAEELDPYPFSLTRVTFDLQDEDDYESKSQTVLDLNPDGVLLAPIFQTESTIFCKQLARQKIPFVFIDGYISNADFLAYIGEDIYQSGRVAGQLLDMITPKEKDILVVNISKNIQNVHHLTNRTQGFISYFKKSGSNKGKKITINIPELTREVVQSEMDKVLKKNPAIGSIFITGSKSYLIADYLERKGIMSINLLGYDLLDLNVNYLKAGILRFLIGQRPEEQAYKGIKKLFEYLSSNKIPEKYEYLPVDIVTSENVDFFLK